MKTVQNRRVTNEDGRESITWYMRRLMPNGYFAAYCLTFSKIEYEKSRGMCAYRIRKVRHELLRFVAENSTKTPA